MREVNGHLSIDKDDGPHKFCHYCGLLLLGRMQKLEKHNRGWHKGQEAKWLRFEENPAEPIYQNWYEWRQNPLIKLKPKDNDGKSLRGRPPKDNSEEVAK